MRKFIFQKRKYGFELLMDIHRFENNPNVFFDPNPQVCDFFEIMIFKEGRGSIDLNGEVLEVASNTIFFICPYQIKSCFIPLEGVKGFHLVFQNDFLSDFFDDKLFAYRLQYFYNAQHPQYLRVEDKEYQRIEFALSEMIGEIDQYQNDSNHIIRSLLYFTLSKLNRWYSSYYAISSDTQSSGLIHQFKELLESHIREFHAVQDYCDLLQIDRHQLNTMVKEHTGNTSKQVISNRLLQEVKRGLRYTQKSISQIAFDLNFKEANNMTRFFRSNIGVSPKSYRVKYQNDRNQ